LENFDQINKNSKTIIVCLLAIIIIAFALRTGIWHFGAHHGLVRHGDGFLDLAEAIAAGDRQRYFSHWRFSQVVYPLYLAPMYYFHLNDSIYVFWMHTFLVSATIVMIYLSSSFLFDQKSGLLSALIYALHLQIAYWINWTRADVAFHFHISLLLYCLLLAWRNRTPLTLFAVTAAGIAIALTRTEGILIALTAFVILIYKKMTERFKPLRVIMIGSVIFTLFLSILTFFTYSQPDFRNKVLSHMYVGNGLYTLSLPTPKTPAETDVNLLAMWNMSIRERSDFGLQRIKQNPWGTVGIFLKRYVEVIYPSTFMEGVSWRYITFDLVITIFLTGGILLAAVLSKDRRPEIIVLFLIAFSIYSIVALYQREWGLRVQLSAHVCLLIAAPFGWYALMKRIIGKVSSLSQNIRA